MAKCSQLQINKRERFKSEWHERHGNPVVRIVRLKPNAAGELRPAGPQLEFAGKHLPGIIAMLQTLQESKSATREVHAR